MTHDFPLLMTGSEWFASRPGGLNRYFLELFRAFDALDGVDVTGLAFGDAPSLTGAKSWRSGGNIVARVAASRRAESTGEAPRVVDRHFALYGPPPRRYPKALQIVHFQGPWADESRVAGGGGVSTRAKRLVERRRYHEADHLIVLSAPFAQILVDDYGIPAERITILPPGVDTERFAAAQSAPTSEPSDDAGPIVLCVRRLEHRMGIDVLIRAWDDISAAIPGAQLRIVGTGTAEAELRELAGRARNPESIVFTGRLSDEALIDEYRRSTITVVPTTSLEGFGLIALESLAAGKAAVVTDCGGLPDAVRGLDASLIVPPADADALGARIIGALEGKRPTAQECVDHAATFSWGATAGRHLDLYLSLGA